MLEVRKDTRARVGGPEPTVATTPNKQYGLEHEVYRRSG